MTKGAEQMLNEKRKVTPQQAVEILEEYGTIITIEEAKVILDFMYKFIILAINQIVNDKNKKTENEKR